MDRVLPGSPADWPRARVTAFKLPNLLLGVKMARTVIQSAPAGRVLRTVSGVSEAYESRWYQVNFDKAFLSKPTVVANAELRQGRWTEGRMQLPTFRPPSFPPPSSEVPRWPTVSVANMLGEAHYAAWRKFFEKMDEKQKQFFTWTFPPGAKEIRATLTKVIWAVFDLLKEDFWMLGGRPGREIEKIINEILPGRISDYSDRLQARFKEYGETFAKNFAKYHAGVQNTAEELRALSENAMNTALPQLYSFVGLPPGVKMTPVIIHNVTSTGFQFLGMHATRMTMHWVAVGPVTAGEEAPPTVPTPFPTLPFPFPPLPLPPPPF